MSSDSVDQLAENRKAVAEVLLLTAEGDPNTERLEQLCELVWRKTQAKQPGAPAPAPVSIPAQVLAALGSSSMNDIDELEKFTRQRYTSIYPQATGDKPKYGEINPGDTFKPDSGILANRQLTILEQAPGFQSETCWRVGILVSSNTYLSLVMKESDIMAGYGPGLASWTNPKTISWCQSRPDRWEFEQRLPASTHRYAVLLVKRQNGLALSVRSVDDNGEMEITPGFDSNPAMNYYDILRQFVSVVPDSFWTQYPNLARHYRPQMAPRPLWRLTFNRAANTRHEFLLHDAFELGPKSHQYVSRFYEPVTDVRFIGPMYNAMKATIVVSTMIQLNQALELGDIRHQMREDIPPEVADYIFSGYLNQYSTLQRRAAWTFAGKNSPDLMRLSLQKTGIRNPDTFFDRLYRDLGLRKIQYYDSKTSARIQEWLKIENLSYDPGWALFSSNQSARTG